MRDINKPLRQSCVARFWAKVTKTENGCWTWTPPKRKDGYGQFALRFLDGYKQICSAHRASYLITHGSVPVAKDIHHACQNRGCVRPDHLVALTELEHHSYAHENGVAFKNRIKTHCKRGHEFTSTNTYITVFNGRERRNCVACNRDWACNNYDKKFEQIVERRRLTSLSEGKVFVPPIKRGKRGEYKRRPSLGEGAGLHTAPHTSPMEGRQ